MRHPPFGRIAVELAEQGIAVFLGPVGQMLHEVFDLVAGGFAKGLYSAEISRVGFDQVGIEFMLANDLAEAVADPRCRSWPLPLAGCGGSFFDSGAGAEVGGRGSRFPRLSRCRCRRLCAGHG